MYMNDIKYIKALVNLVSGSDEQHHFYSAVFHVNIKNFM